MRAKLNTLKTKFKNTTTLTKSVALPGLLVIGAISLYIAEELSKAEYRKTASKEELSAMIESSPTLQKVITQLNEKSQRVVNINAFGDGDAFYGDKVLGDKITYSDN